MPPSTTKRRTWELWMKGSDPIDAALVTLFRRQHRLPSASCPRLQSWATFAAAVRCVDWVMRLVVTRSSENLGRHRLMTDSSACFGAPSCDRAKGGLNP